jgi:Ca2+/H+ antiporter
LLARARVRAAVASLALYALFVFVQTVRHRDYFLPSGTGPVPSGEHAAPPTNREALASLALLIIALVAVVGLARSSPRRLRTRSLRSARRSPPWGSS